MFLLLPGRPGPLGPERFSELLDMDWSQVDLTTPSLFYSIQIDPTNCRPFSLVPLGNGAFQLLSLDCNTLELAITGGNSVFLPTYCITYNAGDLTLTQTCDGVTTDVCTVNIPDLDAQTLALDCLTHDLSISNGNSVTLPTYCLTFISGDLTLTETCNGITTDICTVTIPDLDAQTLALDCLTHALSISNGNSITLPTYGFTQLGADFTFQETCNGVTTDIFTLSTQNVLDVLDEGVSQCTNPTAFNFTGAGVTATCVGGIAKIDIPGSAGSFGYAEYVQHTQGSNASIAPGRAIEYLTDNPLGVFNTIGIATASGPAGQGTSFNLPIGVYMVDYENSADAAWSLAIYQGGSATVLAVDTNTISGASTATTRIHGRAIVVVTALNVDDWIMISPVTGTQAIPTAGTAAGEFIARLTFLKIS